MSDGSFDENFTWYEWSFVSPDNVPTDDLRSSGAQASEYRRQDVDRWESEWRVGSRDRWTTT